MLQDNPDCLENQDKKVMASWDTVQLPAGSSMSNTALLTSQAMLAPKARKEKWGCKVFKVVTGKRGSLAKMELLVKKVNQEKMAPLDLL